MRFSSGSSDPVARCSALRGPRRPFPPFILGIGIRLVLDPIAELAPGEGVPAQFVRCLWQLSESGFILDLKR